MFQEKKSQHKKAHDDVNALKSCKAKDLNTNKELAKQDYQAELRLTLLIEQGFCMFVLVVIQHQLKKKKT